LQDRDVTGDLTKTAFVEGWRCPNRLWWYVHEPDAPERILSESDLLRMEQGQKVNELARSYVPGGVVVARVPDVEQRLERTTAAIASGAPAIYNAAFRTDGVFVEVDILAREGKGFSLVEVKSTTSVKDEHIPDVAIQVHVARGAGVPVTRAELMHLNRHCRYPDLSDLFVREDVTAQVEAILPDIPTRLAEQRRIVTGPNPGLTFGPQCFDMKDCPFTDRCWPEVTRDHVLSLARVKLAKAYEWMQQGIHAIRDLPPDAGLSLVAQRQVRAIKQGAMIIGPGLAEALAAFEAPMAFLDFETVQPAVPVWDGCWPWQQVPVQFSCHVLAPDGTLKHHQWLAEGAGDPREPLARAMIAACAGARTVVSYWATFEKGRIAELAEALPELAPDLLDINRRMLDLYPVVQDHLYHPDFLGSFSLKAVVPALIPELAYDDLEVSEGGEASALLTRYLFEPGAFEAEERVDLRRDLLAYCERDTFVMVALLGRLQQLAGRADR
jgi:predicted RecB family nuclease